jgi:putative two-component system response regulator
MRVTETPTLKSRIKSRILIVDDDMSARCLLEGILQNQGFETALAENGAQALEIVSTFLPDLILLDLMMPGMTGFEVAARLKANLDTRSIPIIVISSLEDRESRLKGLQAGADEFLIKPIDHMELQVRVHNLLRLKQFSDFLMDHNQILETQVRERTSELQGSFVESIFTLMRAAEFRDDETGAHVKRISYYTHELAEQLGMDQEFCELIFYASPMHDIGKIGISDNILQKPGSFSPVEMEIMKSHTTIGAQILANNSSPYLKMGYDIAMGHHERWDGSGYPNGVKGEDIPLPARIMQLADVYDALRSKRRYKPALGHEQAMDIILRGDMRTKPEHFDPAVLAAFQACANIMEEIFATIGDA